MPLFRIFRGAKIDTEAARRERLLKIGRITEGSVLDGDGENDEITRIAYIYIINGAEYESSEFLTAEQRRRQADYSPGAKVSIRYDPRQPGNSIVV